MNDQPQTEAAAAADDTTIVPDVATHAADPLAWSHDTEALDDTHPRRWRPSPAAVTAVALIVSLTAVLAAVTVAYVRLRNAPRPPAAPPPAAAKPLLDGVYRVDTDWAHQTYRGNVEHTTGKPIKWTHNHMPTTSWWAFSTACSRDDCTAVGVKLDDETHSKPDLGIDAQRLVDGEWEDVTPYREHYVCTRAADGTPTLQAWQTSSWGFQPLSDGSFRGTMVITIETDECGDQGDTVVTPITMAKTGPLPAGVLTPVHQG